MTYKQMYHKKKKRSQLGTNKMKITMKSD